MAKWAGFMGTGRFTSPSLPCMRHCRSCQTSSRAPGNTLPSVCFACKCRPALYTTKHGISVGPKGGRRQSYETDVQIGTRRPRQCGMAAMQLRNRAYALREGRSSTEGFKKSVLPVPLGHLMPDNLQRPHDAASECQLCTYTSRPVSHKFCPTWYESAAQTGDDGLPKQNRTCTQLRDPFSLKIH